MYFINGITNIFDNKLQKIFLHIYIYRKSTVTFSTYTLVSISYLIYVEKET